MTTDVPQYFGVAATTTPHEVSRLVEMLDIFQLPDGVKLMNGPLVSRKTLLGKQPDNPAQYPPFSVIPMLLASDPRVFNVIHFNSRDPALYRQLIRIAEASSLVHGIQLNILWPERAEMAEFRLRFPQVRLILQISQAAFDSVGGEVAELSDRIRRYEGLVDYVLFDPSGGTGRDYDRPQATEILEELVGTGLAMRWGVTGGLRADRTFGMKDLLNLYGGLCWDAQSNLRTKPEDGDRLDLENCFGFCAASAALLRWHKDKGAGSF